MLGRFSSVLQNAVDALAPPVPLHEDFAYHWKRLMKHYLDVTNNKQVPIELTNIPSHIDQLLKILLKEEELASLVSGEGSTNSNSSLGPCLEYLLQHSLLDLLVTLASTDDPPGMRQHVLTFIYKFLTHIRAPVVSHTSVFPPIQRLVSLCDGSTPTPTEGDEVHFLLGLTAIIRRNPQLLPCFTTNNVNISTRCDHVLWMHFISILKKYGGSLNYLEYLSSYNLVKVGSLRRGSWSSDASGSQMSMVTSTSQRSALTSGGSDIPGSHTPPPINNPLFSTPLTTGIRAKGVRLLPPEDGDCASEDTRSLATDASANDDTTFPLIDSILSYLDSPDAGVRLKACQALMLMVSLPDDRVASLIANDTLCCARLATKLADLYQEIPANTHPAHIEDLTVSWGLDVPLSPCVSCEGCRQLTAFLSWFDFCDQVLSECHPTVSELLGLALKERFLNEVFPVESLTCVLNLSVITKCLSMATSPPLISVLCRWIVGDEVVRLSPEMDAHQVLSQLLTNWTHSDGQVILETIRLFELLLEKGDEHLMNSLILVYLNDRPYTNGNCNDLVKGLEEVVRFDKQEETISTNQEETKQIKKTEENDAKINRDILSFLSIVPRELRSGGDSGYEQYVSESQRLYAELVSARKSCSRRSSASASFSHYPTSTPCLTNGDIVCSNSTCDDSFEGPFLTTVFNSIRNIPNQEYQVNLELTSVVSRLAVDPDPKLSRLLDPSASLGLALKYVASVLSPRVTANLDYSRLLSETRHSLLSAPHRLTFDWSPPFECVIVLEELCKELAAIAYVKHKLSSPSS